MAVRNNNPSTFRDNSVINSNKKQTKAMNTMSIDGVDYELIPHGQGCTDVPSVVCNGKAYIGQAIPNKPKKDYEILSFLDNYGNRINWQVDLSNVYTHTSWDNSCLALNYTIYSVRRLSDGEVFTIGDQVWWEEAARSNHERFKKGFTISLFEQRVINLRLRVKGVNPVPFSFPFNEVSKWIEDERFFTTFDKVKVNGDTDVVWVVNCAWNRFQTSAHKAMEWLEEERDDFTFFAHENNAIEFQLMNKPCLSVNDVLSNKHYGTNFYQFLDILKEDIVEVAKNKINAEN